ncbi:sensor histidine kinase [Microbacterium sp. NEAU-LLC]|uniref:histidine kinase n=1 Tax=Microbacterium helvum TaxID=2773713 RepID=A0ABR8NMT3_9MICO|nr:histidine kinase [Microbacterium helvum]MBD3941248.1 sensor histidine kinase [Microbacterium helvum]
MTSPVRALWDAPKAAPAPPRHVWRDAVLAGVVAVAAVVEALLRSEVPWRWLWAVVLIGLSATLLWRRTHPLLMLTIAFLVATTVGLATGGDPQLFTTAYFLVLLYALFRWASGRAVLVGGALVVLGTAFSLTSSDTTPGDVAGGIAVVVATGSLGAALRWRARVRARDLEQARLAERVQLARDLHDTVAHHVSAIAVQAQAGTVAAAKDPSATAQVLRTIEAEATQTLREMRAMVGVLRADAAPLAPTPSLAQLDALARTDGVPEIEVRVEGDADAVPAPVAATVFHLAQEAVTNARRHARGVRRIEVDVRVGADGVRLTVDDDGRGSDGSRRSEAPGAAPAAPGTGAVEASITAGYGIRGMQERADLLGGRCEAGPRPDGGWRVVVSLPRTGWRP